ncbi:MAG: 50S ribosomal protein L13 [Candidatus Bathyarchaeota archaeon]|nr:50S ribosomal protein L13 [Candidatus Bathyarchaeota archaeon]
MKRRGKVGAVSERKQAAVIDASNLILGRLASNVAKRILNGEEIIVVNAEKAVISGSRKKAIEDVKKRLGLRTLASQKKAPKRPRRPDGFVKRVVRGMLPWKKPRGKMAYKRLRVFIGVPENLSEISLQTIPEAKKAVRPSVTVGELLEAFGWKNPLLEQPKS